MKLDLTEEEIEELAAGLMAQRELHWVHYEDGPLSQEYRIVYRLLWFRTESDDIILSTWAEYAAMKTVVEEFHREASLGYPGTPLLLERYQRILSALDEIALAVAVEDANGIG